MPEIFKNDDLEIFEHTDEGYKTQLSFGAWRVAIANFKPMWRRGCLTYMERHLKTDEVFVLLSGEASLLIGRDMTEYRMEAGKLYNVKMGAWHQMIMNEDAKVLIVENAETGADNSEYFTI